MSNSPRLGLPFLAAGQAQKEFFHNEALLALDLLVAAAIEEPPRNGPPAQPAEGACYIVGPTPSGAWSGKADQIAGFAGGGWRFFPPVEGMNALIRSNGLVAAYRSSGWDVGTVHAQSLAIAGVPVVGSQQPAIAAPSGGATIDSAARTAIADILSALRGHGLIAS